MQLRKLNKIIILGVFLLMVIQVFVANRITTIGTTISKLETEKQDLKTENDNLERKISTYSSLTIIAQKAKDAGFEKSELIYLNPDVSVALNNLNVSPR